MGPTTAALLRFFQADQAFREANGKLEAATRDVRTQEARVAQLKAEHDATHRKAIESEAKGKELELELKAREERIELLRDRQTNATDDKAYRALIVEINNHKADKAKLEEQSLAQMETLEGLRKGIADLKARGDNEAAKLSAMTAQVDDKVAQLAAEVESLRGPRDEAQAAVPPMAMSVYTRASSRYDGEAMAAIEKPDPRDVEYLCTGCNTYLVANIYNRLMSSKDEVVPCPSCGRVLYVPSDLTPELALSMKAARGSGIAKPKTPKVPKAPKLDADGNPIKRVSKPRVKKEKVAAGAETLEPGSIAAAVAAGKGSASGRGFAAKAPTAPSAPPSTRADGSVYTGDEPQAADDQSPPAPAVEEQPNGTADEQTSAD